MNITYKIKRSRKRIKTISLQISDKSESVTIAAPYFTPVDEINRFVWEKQHWIKKHYINTKTVEIFIWRKSKPLI